MNRWRVWFAVVVVVSAAWTGAMTTASSAITRLPRFAGDAPGAVTCAASVKIRFSNPLTESGGVTSSSVKGKLRDCTSTDGAVSISHGTLTGSFAGSPINCAGPSSGMAPGTFSISWRGDVNGTVETTSYAHKATFNASTSNASGEQLVTNAQGQEGLQMLGTSEGSFSGVVAVSAFSPDTSSQFVQMCETRTTTPQGRGRGVKRLTLTGTITVGTVGQIASDGTGFCALLTTGTVNCWGSGTDGALGNDSTSNSRVPVIIAVTTATSVASDGTHSYCASLASGSVQCWGLNTDGEIGNGTTGTDALVPATVSGVSDAVSIASDGDHSYCALLATGAAQCWGLDTTGELGDNAMSDSDVAVSVVGLNTAVRLASQGAGSYCAVLASTSVDCWGDNGSGDLGNNSTTDSAVPVAVSGLSSVTSVVSDGDHSYCADLTSGTVQCWGKGTNGELGDGANTASHVPVTVSGVTSAQSLASNGNDSYCAVLVGGPVDCWGLNTIGQLGNATTTSSNVPVPVSGVSDATVIAGDGTNSYCLVQATESVECWGAGAQGQLGNGAGANSDIPVTASPMPAAVGIVGEGSATFCSGLASDAVDCWGSNGGGALGDGSAASNSLVPVTVSDLTL